MDVRSLYAAQGYAANLPAAKPQPTDGAAIGHGLAAAAQTFEATLRTAEAQAHATMAGDSDPHALVHALAQSELAVETAVAVRDKVVEAYQEILRMPV